jgi:phosphoglycerate kinase
MEYNINKKTVKDIDIKGKRVLVRVDFNVPLDENGNITDDTRIVAALPTIEYILNQNASVILMSHLGRPKGEVKENLRLNPVAKRLEELLKKPVKKLNDCIGKEVEEASKNIKPGDVILLENLRFHKEEEKNDEEFAKKLASLGDVYVNDAFGAAHRAHASVAAITKFLPSVAGFLLAKEIYYLGNLLKNPERPFIVILGGAKISTKIGVINNLLDKVDKMLIGGGMTFTFLKSKGLNIGTSIVETEKEVEAFEILRKAQNEEKEIVLPDDVVVADEIKEDAKTKVVDIYQIPDNMSGVDIGPKTIKKFKKIINEAKTIFWNGPMGVFEIDKFAEGTKEIAKAVANSNAVTVVGGGDSISALKKFNLLDKITHVSTGGGASLEFVEGKPLPGIVSLQDK